MQKNCFFTLPKHRTTKGNHPKIHRGEVKFHDARKFPKVIGGQSTTLRDRQVWKALCRAVECQKAAPGYRRNKTWQKLFSVIPQLPEQYHAEFQSIAAQPVSLELAQRTETLLQNIYQIQCNENSAQRLLKWKQRMRSDETEAAKWLRTKNKKPILAVSTTKAGPSANSQSRIQTIREAW